MTPEELIRKLEEYRYTRELQKQRGLNDYNVMTAIRKADAEVGMHSNFIYSLLDIDGSHYQGDLFAKLFIEHALLYDVKDFGKIKEVQMEEDADGRRIDFTIKSDKFYIGIEMKINASDQPKQLSDYYDFLVKETTNTNQKVKIYYLTLNGKTPSKDSIGELQEGKEFYNVSFEKNILNWLEACQKEVSNITNLNNAIGYYTDVVKQLTIKYQSPINRYEEFFLNQEIYECYEKNQDTILKDLKDSDEIRKAFGNTKQKLYDDFYAYLLKSILETNQEILFGHYDIKYKKIILSYDKYYEIWIPIENNNFTSIGIRPAWGLIQWQGNKQLKDILDIKNSILDEKQITLKDYLIGSNKRDNINKNYNLPKINVNDLFKNNNKLNNLDELQYHIDIIINALK